MAPSNASASIRRSRVILAIFVILLSACALRLVDLQLVQGPELAAEGEQVRTSRSAIAAKRGQILDATGTVLADSILTYDIAVNQVNIRSYVHYETKEVNGSKQTVVAGRGPAEAARQLSELLGIPEAELGGQLIGDSTYTYLKRNVDAVTFRKIRALDIYGIEWEAVYERIYPNGNTAAPLIGTVNAEGEGSSGIEQQYDSLLQGLPGSQAFEIAPDGAVIPGGKRTLEEPRDGGTVSLTIHTDLQHQVQELLDAAITHHGAEWGAIVVEDVSTGQVLVMADSYSTPPDNANPQIVRAVQYATEPGSVGKVLTNAVALEQGTITPTSVFSVPGSINMPGADGPINDFHQHETYERTATGILVQSSNTGTVQVGDTVSAESRYDMMKKLGFGELTGIELSGESAGLLRPPSEWGGRDRYVSMFGQSYAVTPLQMASMMATIGNGGVRISPRIVKSWTNADGTFEEQKRPEPVQVMSADTAKKVLTMMESVVADPNGTNGVGGVEGYRVGLKTGTAEIGVDGQSGLTGIASTTAGIIPADKPRLAIAVVIYNPKVAYLAASSALPLFGQVAEAAVKNLGIPASAEPVVLYPSAPQ